MSRTTNRPTSGNRHALGARGLSSVIALLVCLVASPVYASHISQIRVGNHPTFTRLVFELDTPTGYRVERQANPDGGERLTVTLDASSRTRDIQSKSAGIASVHVEEHASKAVAQIELRKSGLPMKEMILSNPARIVLDFELPVVAATTPVKTSTAAPKPKSVAPKTAAVAPKKPAVEPEPQPEKVVAKPLPKPKTIEPAAKPEPKPPVIAAVDPVPTTEDAATAERDKQRSAELRAKIPGVHKRDDPAAKPAAKPDTPATSETAANEQAAAKPAPKPLPHTETRAAAEKPSTEKKSPREAAKSAPAPKPKESPINMAIVGAVAAVVLIAGVVLVRRNRKKSMSSALDVAALAEEAELDAAPAADSSTEAQAVINESIPVKGFSMDGDSRAIEPSLKEGEEHAAYSMSEVAENETEAEPEPHQEDTEGEKQMDLDASDMSVDVESGNFNAAPPVVGGGSADSQLVQDLAARLATLENRLDEASEARERLERQVAAQSEELRVQRAAIARTQRALRSLSRSEAEQATEPALRDPAKRADSPA